LYTIQYTVYNSKYERIPNPVRELQAWVLVDISVVLIPWEDHRMYMEPKEEPIQPVGCFLWEVGHQEAVIQQDHQEEETQDHQEGMDHPVVEVAQAVDTREVVDHQEMAHQVRQDRQEVVVAEALQQHQEWAWFLTSRPSP
jgi:hypothetical protein